MFLFKTCSMCLGFHTYWELALADQGTFNLSFSCHHGGLHGSCYSC